MTWEGIDRSARTRKHVHSERFGWRSRRNDPQGVRPTVTNVCELVHRYVALWNEEDDEARRRQIAALWTEDAVYTDPVVTMTGHEAIEALITTARSEFSGYALRLLTEVDAHHNVARFACEVVPPDGGHPALISWDLAVASDDGKLRYVYDFIDVVASRETGRLPQ
jgi:hypothetical protein